jgi:hypothetical protein
MTIDYKEVLTDLRRRRAELERRHQQEIRKLDSAIQAIEEMVPRQQVAIAFGGQRKEGETANSLPYADKKTIREAALECLTNQGRSMKTKELAHELVAGGFPTQSKNFATTVYGTLARYGDEFTVDDGVWSLVEWDRRADQQR